MTCDWQSEICSNPKEIPPQGIITPQGLLLVVHKYGGNILDKIFHNHFSRLNWQKNMDKEEAWSSKSQFWRIFVFDCHTLKVLKTWWIKLWRVLSNNSRAIKMNLIQESSQKVSLNGTFHSWAYGIKPSKLKHSLSMCKKERKRGKICQKIKPYQRFF